jgi:hypothetical protein
MLEAMAPELALSLIACEPYFGTDRERIRTVAERENHTLQLLREFRREFKKFHKEFSDFRVHTDERFEELVRLFAGEGVLGRYAAADVDKRLQALEKRMTKLERARS